MITLREVSERVGGRIASDNSDLIIRGVASLAEAGEGDISFCASPKYLSALKKSRASAVLVPPGFEAEFSAQPVWVEDPALAFVKLQEIFAPPPVPAVTGVHPTAVVSDQAVLGEGVGVGPHTVIEAGAVIGAGTTIAAQCYIGHGVRLGSECRIFPQVVVRDYSVVGNRVILHPGVVIGSDGFGYEFREGRHQKIPQTGIVQIDDDVEIGANSTIDRARFGRTWIQEGTKIDNLVQIGHNVTVGRQTIICAQVGISGSTQVGNRVTLAGKVGINGHIEIGDGVVIAAMAGVTKDVPSGEILIGLPARPAREFKENFVLLSKIRKLYDRVKKLEKLSSSSET